uniref:Multidrug-efflux transporter n=1 Tax=Candidatus Kentrum sp. LFY TaxID=2126342 RepID=A0A450UKG2_9GAMM|nr:MAG: multidrug resistance protein, MATE family [Candidatus Kentron sp. LFY]
MPKSVFLNTSELRDILTLSLPLIAGKVGDILIGVTDTIMLGRLGPDALGAAGLAFSVYQFILMIGLGILFPTIILVSRARGAGRSRAVPRIIRQGLWLSGILFIPGAIILWNLEGILLMAGQAPELVRMAGNYMDYFMWAMFPEFTFNVFIAAFIAMGRAGTLAIIIWFAAGLNATLNYLLIFGEFGFPAMGMAGAGLASVIVFSTVHITFFLLLAFHRSFRSTVVFRRAWRPNRAILGQFFRLGWPEAFEMVMKNGSYLMAALFSGWLGVQVLAAHTIGYQIFIVISLVILMPIADATITRIGIVSARGKQANIWLTLNSGLLLFFLFMLIPIMVIKSFSPWVVMAFVGSGPEIQALLPIATPLVVFVAFYSLIEGLCTVVEQALNGLKDMKVPALITVLAYWVIGLPSGVVFGFSMDLGVLGIWWGLGIGAAVAGMGCLIRFKWMTRNPLQLT